MTIEGELKNKCPECGANLSDKGICSGSLSCSLSEKSTFDPNKLDPEEVLETIEHIDPKEKEIIELNKRIKDIEKKIHCPECNNVELSNNGTCKSFSCDPEKIIIDPNKLAALKFEITELTKKVYDLQVIEKKEKIEKETQTQIDSFLTSINGFLNILSFDIKGIEEDSIKYFLSKATKSHLDIISAEIEKELELLLGKGFDKTEFINKLNKKLAGTPIMELFAKADERFSFEKISIKETAVKEEQLIIDLFIMGLKSILKEETASELNIDSPQEVIKKFLSNKLTIKNGIMRRIEDEIFELVKNTGGHKKEKEIINKLKKQLSKPIIELLIEISYKFRE